MIFLSKQLRWVWLFVLPLAFSAATFAQDRIDVSNTHEILITSVRESEQFRGSQKGDEALLIKDKAEIARLVTLFNNNLQGKVHACGYHWRLTFYRTGAAPTEIFFNEKCEDFERNTEQICELVQATFRQTVKHPNAYVTNLKIDVTVPVETARDELASKGQLRILSLRDVSRLPYVEILASSTSQIPEDRALWNAAKTKTVLDADQALVNDIARIRGKYHVVEIGEIKHDASMFGGGQIMEQRGVAIYFDVGENLESVGSVLNKSKIGSTVIPATYDLQVLTTSRLTASDARELQKKLSFVKATDPY